MNKTALITGASKRIGRAVAGFLAEKEWNIIIHYNNSEHPANELKNLLVSKYPGQKFGIIKANLSDSSEVTALIPKVISKFGNLNLLINNASVFNRGFIQNTSIDLFDNEIDINLKAPFILMRDFAKHCKKGDIINFVDTRITSNKSDFAAYSLSKKALWELTKMAALEFAPNIRVNAIAPGATLAPADKDENYLAKLAQNIAMKQPGGIAPVLKSIAYILDNNYLTGQLLFADGGENLGTPPGITNPDK
jgi:NAD(P)-dependent dehydrogenase (short-subunit alcohol dehydrogenase family)